MSAKRHLRPGGADSKPSVPRKRKCPVARAWFVVIEYKLHIDKAALAAQGWLQTVCGMIANPVQIHSALKSSGTSPNFRISLASPNSLVAGSRCG